EIRLGDGEFGPGIGPEPQRVGVEGLAGDADHFLGVELVLGKGDDADANGGSAGSGLGLALEDAIACATDKGELADANRLEVETVPATGQLGGGAHLAGAGDFLVAGQDDGDVVDARLVEERLMPGDERSRLPGGGHVVRGRVGVNLGRGTFTTGGAGEARRG